MKCYSIAKILNFTTYMVWSPIWPVSRGFEWWNLYLYLLQGRLYMFSLGAALPKPCRPALPKPCVTQGASCIRQHFFRFVTSLAQLYFSRVSLHPTPTKLKNKMRNTRNKQLHSCNKKSSDHVVMSCWKRKSHNKLFSTLFLLPCIAQVLSPHHSLYH